MLILFNFFNDIVIIPNPGSIISTILADLSFTSNYMQVYKFGPNFMFKITSFSLSFYKCQFLISSPRTGQWIVALPLDQLNHFAVETFSMETHI